MALKLLPYPHPTPFALCPLQRVQLLILGATMTAVKESKFMQTVLLVHFEAKSIISRELPFSKKVSV